jgi:double-strand break repair protein MRE11
MDEDAQMEAAALRVLIASDNHLGYMEADPVRCNDSFAAFEEVLQLAKRHKVDFVLLGGDLFHDNKPSRHSVFKAISILRKYTMGDDPIKIKIFSDQKQNFRDGRVNYEDPNVNIALPVFTIHGNHDDPTRDGGTEALSACDLLSACGSVNYFGTNPQIKQIDMRPVLIEKGPTKLALYGLGNVRDERLNRSFTKEEVKFVRPAVDKEKTKDYFNMFVLHQNRDYGRGPKNCVHESFIPKFFDLVVWGHEHECMIDPMESTHGYHITQPGSSVATSLVPGEAERKHVGLLSIYTDQFKLEKIPLSTVRPFIYKEVDLSECEELSGLASEANSDHISMKVHEVLTQKVEEEIQAAHETYETDTGFPGLSRGAQHRVLPLIMLKVERTGFPMLNVTRFGNQFMGRVANPSKLVRFYRRKSGARRARRRPNGELVDLLEAEVTDASGTPVTVSRGITGQQMGVRIAVELEKRDTPLELLPEEKLNQALDAYVAKGEVHAFADFIEKTVKKTQRALKRNNISDPAKIKELVAKDTNATRQSFRESTAKLSAATEATSTVSREQENLPAREMEMETSDISSPSRILRRSKAAPTKKGTVSLAARVAPRSNRSLDDFARQSAQPPTSVEAIELASSDPSSEDEPPSPPRRRGKKKQTTAAAVRSSPRRKRDAPEAVPRRNTRRRFGARETPSQL